MQPKEKRKSQFKERKEKLEKDHEEKVRFIRNDLNNSVLILNFFPYLYYNFRFQEKIFLEKLNENHESSLRRQSDSHREKIALMERQFLQQKQQVGFYPNISGSTICSNSSNGRIILYLSCCFFFYRFECFGE